MANKAQGNVDEKEDTKPREVMDVDPNDPTSISSIKADEVGYYCVTEYQPRHNQLEARTPHRGTKYPRT